MAESEPAAFSHRRGVARGRQKGRGAALFGCFDLPRHGIAETTTPETEIVRLRGKPFRPVHRRREQDQRPIEGEGVCRKCRLQETTAESHQFRRHDILLDDLAHFSIMTETNDNGSLSDVFI